jgi:hypothetical protein
MKTIYCLVLFMILYVSYALGQDLEEQAQTPTARFLLDEKFDGSDSVYRSKNTKFHKEQFIAEESGNTKWPEKLFLNVKYSGGLIGNTVIPVKFSCLEIANGKASIGLQFSLGLGYAWTLGDFTFVEDGEIKISSKFFFGAAAGAGAKKLFDTSRLGGSLTVELFVGFQDLSLFGGFDLFSGHPVFSLGTKVSFQSISSSSFHLFGRKINPIYRVPRDAKPLPEWWYPK